MNESSEPVMPEDFAKMAEAYGAGGAEADTIEELQQALRTAIEATRQTTSARRSLR